MMNFVLDTPLALDIVDNAVQNQSLPITNNTLVWLGIGLIVNIIITGLNFCFQIKLKKQDSIIDKQRLINTQRVEIESNIYNKLSHLSSFQKNESHSLLDAIEELQTYVNANHLYFSDKLNVVYTDIIDYYSKVCVNFKKKDLNKETRMLKKYKRIFNG